MGRGPRIRPRRPEGETVIVSNLGCPPRSKLFRVFLTRAGMGPGMIIILSQGGMGHRDSARAAEPQPGSAGSGTRSLSLRLD